MPDTSDPPEAAEQYSAAFERLCARFAQDWIATDWSDGPLSWRFFRRRDAPTADQGWKIHVSASAVESAELLSTVGTVLQSLDAAFKIPRRIGDVVFLNSGDAGAEQAGKILTVYPNDDEHARQLILRLDASWPSTLGPEVQTDLHLRPGSAVSFRFGAYGGGEIVVGHTGVHEYAVTLPDGSRAADLRVAGGQQPPVQPPLPGCPPRPWPIRLNEPFEVNGRCLVALRQLHDSPRARTLLGADLDSLETVVIKIGRPGIADNAQGLDTRRRFGHEFEVLTALASQPGVAPRPLEWRDGEWPILVVEDFRGPLLTELPRRERISRLPALARAVTQVHAAGFVHCDVKLDNAVVCGEDVGLIDFELAVRAGTVAPAGGTRGFLAPETRERVPAAFPRDVYALGACVAHALLDVPPGLLPRGGECIGALLDNEGLGDAAPLVAQLTAADPAARPTAAAAVAALEAGGDDSAARSSGHGAPSAEPEREWQRRACRDAAALVASYAQPDGDGFRFRNTHFLRAFDCEAINLGAAGIVLGLVTIDTALESRGSSDLALRGARWLAARPSQPAAAGLFTGDAGVALSLAVAGRRFDDARLIAAARSRFESACAARRELDLFSGSAGVAWTAGLLCDIVGESWPMAMAEGTIAHLRACAGETAGIPVWAVDRAAEVPYLGCAHGSAGIALALAGWGRRTGDRACLETAHETLAKIAALGRTADGSAMRMDASSVRHHVAGNWCHGVAGYLWALLAGFGGEAGLGAEIDWAVGCLDDAPSTGTPTFCHGLAGQLELWRMLCGVPRHRALAEARAGKVARALRIVHHLEDGRCAWISDDPDIVTPDLWIGFLGPASALAMHTTANPWPLLSGEWLASCARS